MLHCLFLNFIHSLFVSTHMNLQDFLTVERIAVTFCSCFLAKTCLQLCRPSHGDNIVASVSALRPLRPLRSLVLIIALHFWSSSPSDPRPPEWDSTPSNPRPGSLATSTFQRCVPNSRVQLAGQQLSRTTHQEPLHPPAGPVFQDLLPGLSSQQLSLARIQQFDPNSRGLLGRLSHRV